MSQKKLRLNISRPYSRVRLVRSWLADIGYCYCGQCHQAVPLDKMAVGYRRCKACRCEWILSYVKTERGRTYQKQYRTTDKYKQYQKVWHMERWRKMQQAKREATSCEL